MLNNHSQRAMLEQVYLLIDIRNLIDIHYEVSDTR